jgi:hypothetical protein
MRIFFLAPMVALLLGLLVTLFGGDFTQGVVTFLAVIALDSLLAFLIKLRGG